MCALILSVENLINQNANRFLFRLVRKLLYRKSAGLLFDNHYELSGPLANAAAKFSLKLQFPASKGFAANEVGVTFATAINFNCFPFKSYYRPAIMPSEFRLNPKEPA